MRTIHVKLYDKRGDAPDPDITDAPHPGEVLELSFRIKAVNANVTYCVDCCVYKHCKDERRNNHNIHMMCPRSPRGSLICVSPHTGMICGFRALDALVEDI